MHLGYEPVTPGRDRDYESWCIRVIAQRPPNLPYRGINAGVAIQENPFSPDSLQDLFACDQLTRLFGEQEEQIERDALQVHDLAAAAEFAGAAVQLEIFESQHPRRQPTGYVERRKV
jgi:hypothetical protein